MLKMIHQRRMSLQKIQQLFFTVVLLTAILCVILILSPKSSLQVDPPAYGDFPRCITMRTEGRRFGNMMFSYASLLGIAKQNNMTPVLPSEFPLREVFLAKMIHGDSQKSMSQMRRYEEFGRRSCAYDKQTDHLWKDNPYEWELNGYYQSWKYFSNVAAELRQVHFQFLSFYKYKAELFFKHKVPIKLQDPATVRIGIHVRRGDHMDEEKRHFGYTVADKQYIESAMKYFTQRYDNIVFIVCSENHKWFQKEIGNSDSLPNVVFSYEKDPAIDMAILSMCNHTIITVGSFGWWAAWLSNGTTIYYNNWPAPRTSLDYRVTKKDYFPPQWIPIPHS